MNGYMNEPKHSDGQAYVQDLWVMCPYCGRRQFKIQNDTVIQNMTFKCKNTKCKCNMMINIVMV